MIENRLLRQFVAVAEELHFRRAAERLNMAQPPLSQAIRKLEIEIGASLFERTNRQVALTPAGMAFLDVARTTLQTLADGVDHTRRVAAGVAGRLAVGFLDMSHPDFIPAVLKDFRTAFPRIELTLQEGTTTEQIEAIRTQSIDIGFMRRPGLATPDLTIECVTREPVLIALPKGHGLAALSSLPLSRLASEPFVMTPREKGPGFHDQILELCRLAGFSPVIAQFARQMQTVLGLVSAGFGVALVPASLAATRREGVVFRPVEVDAPDDMLHLDLIIAWDDRRASTVRDRFVETIRAVRDRQVTV